MARNKNVNFIYSLIYEIIVILSPLIVTPYISRVLGVELVGVRSYTFAIVSYFELFISIGITIYGQREIAKCGDDIQKRSKTFFSLFFIKFVLFIIVLSVYCTLFFGFEISENYKTIYLIWIIHIFESLLTITWFFQGIEEFKYISIRGVIFRTLQIVLTIILVKSKDDFYTYLIIYASIPLVQAISLWLFLPKYVEFKYLFSISIKEHLKSIFIFFIPTIATTIYSSIDKVMLGSILNDNAQVGYYESAQHIALLATTIFLAIYSVMRTRISYEIQNKPEKVKVSTNYFINIFMLVVIPVSIGILCVSKNFVLCFFGDEYEPSAKLLSMFVSVIFLMGVSGFISAVYIVPYDKQKYLSVFYIIAVVINVIINFILIPYLESSGAVIGSIAAEFFVFLGCVYISRKEIKLNLYFKYGWKCIVSGIIMGVSVFLLAYFLDIGVVYLVIEIFAGIMIYGLSLIILKDKVTMDVGVRMIKKINSILRKCYYLLLSPRISSKYRSTKKKFDSLYKKYDGPCFIVGNGPSLKIEDLEIFKRLGIPSIGVNRIYKIFDKTNWRPDFLVTSDSKVIKNSYKEINELDETIIKFSRVVGLKKYDINNAIFYNFIDPNYKWKDGYPKFFDGKDGKFSCGKTVIFVAIQIAVYMGFNEIYLIGCDCNYNTNNNKVNENSYADKRMQISKAYVNENEMIKSFESAKDYCVSHNINIYNATRGGMLEVFERVDIDDFFKKMEEKK